MNQNRERCKLSICAIMKNEGPYLVEWLEFHKLVGVERFYLYNNNSTDNTLEITKPYQQTGEVILQDWSCNMKQQMQAYNHCIINHQHESEWIAFIDLDEFLFATEKNDLRVVLDEYINYQAVAVNWLIFGTSGHEKKPEGLQIENYTKRAKDDFEANRNYKCILRSQQAVKCLTPHHFVYVNNGVAVTENREPLFLNQPLSRINSVKKLRINHYFTRSKQEMINKVRRGRATVPKKRTMAFTAAHDRNEVEDLTIQRFLPDLKDVLKNRLTNSPLG